MRFLLIIVALWACIGATNAQDAKPAEEEAVAPKKVEPLAPYDPQLLRLSEVLGSVHYLRALCGANEGNKWRDVMQKLVIAEEPGPIRRARLVSSFNRGYRAFDGTYGSCTPSALLAVERYMKEGALLSSKITARYGR